MKRKLTIHPRADIDLAHHYLYLLERGLHIAERFEHAISEVRIRIANSPSSCATLVVEGFESLELRFVRPNGFPTM